jgi:hypothetical protein
MMSSSLSAWALATKEVLRTALRATANAGFFIEASFV